MQELARKRTLAASAAAADSLVGGGGGGDSGAAGAEQIVVVAAAISLLLNSAAEMAARDIANFSTMYPFRQLAGWLVTNSLGSHALTHSSGLATHDNNNSTHLAHASVCCFITQLAPTSMSANARQAAPKRQKSTHRLTSHHSSSCRAILPRECVKEKEMKREGEMEIKCE